MPNDLTRTASPGLPIFGVAWPNDPDNVATDLRVMAELVTTLDGDNLAISRVLTSGGRVLSRSVAWSGELDDPALVTACGDWLSNCPDSLAAISSLACIVSAERIREMLLRGGREEIARRAEEARKAEKALRAESRRAEAELEIRAFFRGRKSFRLDLEREIDDGPFWSATFGEAWERDRFWDWLKWQDHRFEEYRAAALAAPGVELERSLLKEMLASERAARREGLAAGGRRPLRFWRGDR